MRTHAHSGIQTSVARCHSTKSTNDPSLSLSDWHLSYPRKPEPADISTPSHSKCAFYQRSNPCILGSRQIHYCDRQRGADPKCRKNQEATVALISDQVVEGTLQGSLAPVDNRSLTRPRTSRNHQVCSRSRFGVLMRTETDVAGNRISPG